MRLGLKLRAVALGLLLLLVLGVAADSAAAASAVRLSGRVTDTSGSPIGGAIVYAFKRSGAALTARTDAAGYYSLEYDPAEVSEVIVVADIPSTPAVDYLPKRVQAPAVSSTLDFKLAPVATFKPVGNIQFVETESIPSSVTLVVVDAEGKALEDFKMTLTYSGSQRTDAIPGVEVGVLLVPAGSPCSIKVTANLLVGDRLAERSFMVDPQGIFQQGERRELDLFPSVVAYNVDFVESTLRGTFGMIDGMERKGFYLSSEKTTVSRAEATLRSGEMSYDRGSYREAYDSLKLSYISLRKTGGDLVWLQREAEFSVSLITGFLAVASIAAGFLAMSTTIMEASLSTVFFGLSSGLLYVVYPGASSVTAGSYALNAALIFSGTLIVSLILPRLLAKTSGGDRVNLLTILVPVLSIAKRNLTRRRLRFALTLTTVTVLVMSFVALTSFSEGYGLTVGAVAATPQFKGVLLRGPDWVASAQTYMPMTAADTAWLEGQAEIAEVARKTQNLPSRYPFGRVGSEPINGIVGVEKTEEKVSGLAGCLTAGRLPGEGEVALAESLLERLGLSVGSTLVFQKRSLRVSGSFGDGALRLLDDMDGSGYLPDRMVNQSPPGEMPVYTQETCDPGEVLFFEKSFSETLGLAGLSRVALTLKPGVDSDKFAEQLALERGYQAFSATSKGITKAALGGYFEGKGLPLLIPWGIVVLNMVVTMLNSLYERRREISILSSVGLNPAEIASIFVGEAAVTGFIGGGLGYLLGLTLYQAMPALGLALEVHMKVSAAWSLASVAIAITAVLAGAAVALRSSVVITPSLARKWRLDDEPRGTWDPWKIPIPMKLEASEVEPFVEFLLNRLRREQDSDPYKTSSIKKEVDGEKTVIRFAYMSTMPAAGNFYTKNWIAVAPDADGVFRVALESSGDRERSYMTGSFIRQLAMEWSDRPRNGR